MSLYVEIMCDERKDWAAENKAKGPIRHRCLTNAAENPHGPNVAAAKAEARAQGWKVAGNRATCPRCLKEPTLTKGHPQ